MTEFQAHSRAYSRGNAYYLGELARIAYQDPEPAQAQLAELKLGWEHSFLFLHNRDKTRDTQALFAGNAEVLLAFRGTEPDQVRDWATDFDADFSSGPGGKVHEGFLTALQLIWGELWQYLRSERHGRPLWITGHSLGGALAILTAARLRLEKDEPVHGVYTFGQPRVGDREFAKNFDAALRSHTFRYVNNNDIVPRVPFRAMHYSHVGEFRYFDEYGVQRDNLEWWDMLGDRVQGALHDVLRPGVDGLKDHAIDNYLAGLSKALSAPAEAGAAVPSAAPMAADKGV